MTTISSQIDMSTTGFIGRADILGDIDGVIRAKGTKKVVCIEGSGGIGKTRLLMEIYRRYASDSDLTVVGVLDFDNTFFHMPGNLEQRIVQTLGVNHFDDYWRKVKTLRALERTAGAFEELAEQESEAKRAFINNLNSYTKTKRVILLMDTAEKQKNIQTWERLLTLMENAENAVLLIAGRDDEKNTDTHNRFLEFQSRLSTDQVDLKSLEPLKPEESLLYINEKQKNLRINLDAQVVNGLLTLSQGRPILLDLAIEWVSRDLPQKWIIDAAQKQLSTSDLNARRRDFEYLLVNRITQIRTPLDRLYLLLSRVYPLDSDGIAQLLRITPAEASNLYKEAITYVFIKQLPGYQISLHDEMRRMIDDYVWPAVDKDNERRVHESKLAKDYLKQKIDAATRAIQKIEEVQTSSASLSLSDTRPMKNVMETYTLEREKWVIRGLYLFHALYADIENGAKEFIRLFDEDSGNNSRGILVNQIAQFIKDIPDTYRHEIISRQINLFVREGNFSRAMELGEQILSATNPDLRLDGLTKLANVKINLGRAMEAIRDLKEALQICEVNPELKQWQGNVLNMLGMASRTTGRLADASRYYTQALNALKLSGNQEKMMAAILNNLGYVVAQDGRYRSAMTYCQQALAMREKSGDKLEIGACFSTIGEVHRNWGKYADALEYYNRALQIFEPENARPWLSRVYGYRGAVYRLLGDFDQAEYDLKKSIDFNVPAEKPWAYHVLGCVYWNRGDLEAAIEYFQKSDLLAKASYDTRTHINNIVGTAEIFYSQWMNSSKTDLTLLEKINVLSRELQQLIENGYDFPHHFGRMQRVLGDIAFETNDYDGAIQTYAEAYSSLGKRSGGYGKRKFSDELDWLAHRIDTMAKIDIEKTISSCNWLLAYWSNEDLSISRRDELTSFCDVMLVKHGLLS